MKPMLAASQSPVLADLKYPVLASPKLDGIRCLIINGQAMSRTLKPIPNRFVQEWAKDMPHGLDGELMVDGDFNKVQSAIMSQHGQPDFSYNVFDLHNQTQRNFEDRYAELTNICSWGNLDRVKLVHHSIFHTAEGLERYWNACCNVGHEGTMVRDPKGPYKHGRSTLKQGWLLKLKKWHDMEGEVTALEPLVREDGSVEDMLGAFVLKIPKGEVRCGSGFTEQQRIDFWAQVLPGRIVTFKYTEESAKGIPRFPIFKGFRFE